MVHAHHEFTFGSFLFAGSLNAVGPQDGGRSSEKNLEGIYRQLSYFALHPLA